MLVCMETMNINTGHRIVTCEIVRKGGKVFAFGLKDQGAAKVHMAQIPKVQFFQRQGRTIRAYVLNELALQNRSGINAETLL